MNKGIPDLGITAKRADELTDIYHELYKNNEKLWKLLIAVENYPDLTLREKLLVIAVAARC